MKGGPIPADFLQIEHALGHTEQELLQQPFLHGGSRHIFMELLAVGRDVEDYMLVPRLLPSEIVMFHS